MRILFIGNSRIGDFILSSGLISHLVSAYPDARLTLVCGDICANLATEIPNLERLIPLRKMRFHAHWFGLWQEVRHTRWDIVVDLRNSAVSRLISSGHAYRLIRPTGLHKVEEAAQVLRLSYTPDPHIWIADSHREFARKLLPSDRPVIALGPGATHLSKCWPAERFAELAYRLISADGPFPGAAIAILGAPDEKAAAKPILDRIAPEHVFDLMEKADLLQAAAIIEKCTAYIGNDNGQMHLAAAVGTPTIGLFGPTPVSIYRPWGPKCIAVETRKPQTELAEIQKKIGPDKECLMGSLEVDDVISAICRLNETRAS